MVSLPYNLTATGFELRLSRIQFIGPFYLRFTSADSHSRSHSHSQNPVDPQDSPQDSVNVSPLDPVGSPVDRFAKPKTNFFLKCSMSSQVKKEAKYLLPSSEGDNNI